MSAAFLGSVRGETDADQPRLILGLDREAVQKSVEQRDGFALSGRVEQSGSLFFITQGARPPWLALPSPAHALVRNDRALSRAADTLDNTAPGFNLVRKSLSEPPRSLEEWRRRHRAGTCHAPVARCLGGACGILFEKFRIILKSEFADDPGRQAPRFQNGDLGIDLRVIAADILHRFLDLHDARGRGFNHDEHICCVERRHLEQPVSGRTHGRHHRCQENPLPPPEGAEEPTQVDLAGIGHGRQRR